MKTASYDDVRQSLGMAWCLSQKDREEIIKNTEKEYLKKFKKDIHKWISIADYIEVVESGIEDSFYLTPTEEIKELIEKIKASKIVVVSMKDFLEVMKAEQKKE